MPTEIEIQNLYQAMLALYTQVKEETGYRATRYLQAVRKNPHRIFEYAKRLLKRPAEDSRLGGGFQAVLDAGIADKFSVEAIVLRPEFIGLFTEEEINEAKRRLALQPKRKQVTPESNYPETLDESENYVEGATHQIRINAYERNQKAREACLKKHGYRCKVCNMSFEAVYGDIGRQYIHVHHIKPLAIVRAEYKIDPITDLAPVCPNCHAMLHTSNPPLEISALRKLLNERRQH
jgi:5-methylcytosine-specific restriction protein A